MPEFNIFNDNQNEEKTKAVLVTAIFRGDDKDEAEISLDELERLLETAGGECVARMTQIKTSADPATYIGSGKIKELSELCKNNGATLVVFDTELSPSQIRNIENEVNSDDSEIFVIDRSMLILDIFALHAKTGEGKLQVELALLKYTTPRLTGKGLQLSRQGGGIGTRGPGESKLESDKRHIKRRMDALEDELEILEKNRSVQRKQRDKSGLYKIAIAGYTNAGKSTFLNYLTGAGILAENKLFATLDPTTRKYELPSGNEILLTDTVGFIRNLPHHLIKAFRSTLDEVVYSDCVLVMIDASEPECHKQLSVTENLLDELGASGKPILYVYNKCDVETDIMPKIKQDAGDNNIFFISSVTGEGIDKLISRIEEYANDGKTDETFLFPHNDQSLINVLYKNAVILSTDYLAEGVKISATVDAKTKGILSKYLI
ncbi:MAG: GTPase HflX [Ruminococcaceae bacterium]|nr:GTPase HflX [Oscillospiraceae bacterium]